MRESASKQISLFNTTSEGNLTLPEVSVQLANKTYTEERGAIFTKTEVVEFILDLIGYTEDRPLHTYRLLEPAFGEGSFLLITIRRLLKAWKIQSREPADEILAEAITGVELHKGSFLYTRDKIIDLLIEEGLTCRQAEKLVVRWLHNTDFLLFDIADQYDYIVGNPPYVRQELIPPQKLMAYKRRYHTIFDRADLYVPFFERSLSLLQPKGQLGFICTDRWMKNRYGGPLRKYISDQFHLKYYINMVGADAFETRVTVYPAITVIAREKGTITRAAKNPVITAKKLASLCMAMRAQVISKSGIVEEIEDATAGSEPWILHVPRERALVKRLEMQFPRLEETGCKVGICLSKLSTLSKLLTK